MIRTRPITDDEREILDDLLALEEGLTDWEAEFVDSIAKQLERSGGLLTARQLHTLHAIGDRRL